MVKLEVDSKTKLSNPVFLIENKKCCPNGALLHSILVFFNKISARWAFFYEAIS